MSHDGSWILRSNGQERYFYTRWGALSFDRDLLQGFESLAAFVPLLEELPKPFLDTWLEGLVVIDADAKRLLYWASQFAEGRPLSVSLFESMITARWPGWTTSWLLAPALEIVEALPHLAPYARGALEPPEPYPVDQFARDQDQPWEEARGREDWADFRGSVGARESAECLTHHTWVVLDDRSVLIDDGWNCSSLLRSGPPAVDVIRARPDALEPPWGHLLDSCYRIDTEHRRIDWWISRPVWVRNPLVAVAERWPGWSFRPLRAGPPQLAKEMGLDPRALVRREGIEATLETVERVLGHRSTGADLLATALRTITVAPGERVSVVPPGPGDDGPEEMDVDLRQLAEHILAEERFQPLEEPTTDG